MPKPPLTRRSFSFSTALSVVLVLSLLAAVIFVEPAVAQGAGTSSASSDVAATSASTPTTAPTRSDRPDAPTDVRAVATAEGTEVRWNAPTPTELAPAPTGYLIVGCGPYAFGSVEATTAADAVCLNEVPGFATMTPVQKATSSVTVDIMSRKSSQTSGSGYRVLGQLASCTLANTCTSDDAVKVQTISGAMVVSGAFPQWIAWTPPGAWLRVTVRLHDGRSAVTYVDIPFRGDSLPCNDGRILTNTARGACSGVYDAMRYGADLEWSETYAWAYSMSANGALPWISSNPAAFDGRLAYPNQYGLTGGMPFVGDVPPPT